MANEKQADYWNAEAGRRWVEERRELDRLIEPLTEALLEGCGARPGERVLDVGCGTAATTLRLASAVAPDGAVVGLDLSAVMLEGARRRLEEEGAPAGPHLELRLGDAQTDELGQRSFDLVVSRFGVMFFDDGVAAFQNLRRALRPDGRLVFLCWGPLERNPWAHLPLRAVAEQVELPPAQPDAPGPFRLADPIRIESLLEQAGWRQIVVEPIERELELSPKGLDTAVDLALRLGPGAALLRDATAEQRAAVARSLRRSLEPYLRDGRPLLSSHAWRASALP